MENLNKFENHQQDDDKTRNFVKEKGEGKMETNSLTWNYDNEVQRARTPIKEVSQS